MSRLLQYLGKNPLTLIVSLPANDPGLAQAALDGGAQVLKVHINLQHRASGTYFGPLDQERDALEAILRLAGSQGVPVGIVPRGEGLIEAREVVELAQMGFDFISAYTHHLGAEAITVEGIMTMAAPDSSLDHMEVRALRDLPVEIIEASIIPASGYGERLTLRDLMAYRGLVLQTGKPVVVPTQRKITTGDLVALSQTGVRGLMIGAVVTGREAEGIRRVSQEFARAITALG